MNKKNTKNIEVNENAKLRQVVRPKFTQDPNKENDKIFLLRQMSIATGKKKDKSLLPPTVQNSMIEKARINSLINKKKDNSPEGLRERHWIQTKPLTKKSSKDFLIKLSDTLEQNRRKNQEAINKKKKSRKKKLSVEEVYVEPLES